MIVSEALKYESQHSQVSGVRSQDLHSFRLLCRCAPSLDFRLTDKFKIFLVVNTSACRRIYITRFMYIVIVTIYLQNY